MLQVQKLLQKKMTRREFLMTLGMMILAISGVSGLLSNLERVLHGERRGVSSGFGSGPYGV